MSAYQKTGVLFVTMLLVAALLLFNNRSTATPQETIQSLQASQEVKREPCGMTFGETHFDGYCEKRYDNQGNLYIGLYGEDGQLDIIMRARRDGSGTAVYFSPRAIRLMQSVSA